MKYLKRFIEISNKQRVFENNSDSTIQLIDGYAYDGNAILSPENPIEIIYKIFDVYYKGCDIIKGMEGETEWTIIASKDDSDRSHYFEMGFEKDKSDQQLNIRKLMEIKPEDYPNFEFIFTINICSIISIQEIFEKFHFTFRKIVVQSSYRAVKVST